MERPFRVKLLITNKKIKKWNLKILQYLLIKEKY